MATYIALLRKDPDSDYGVDFPDFPGCVTAGTDLDEASASAREAGLHRVLVLLVTARLGDLAPSVVGNELYDPPTIHV